MAFSADKSNTTATNIKNSTPSPFWLSSLPLAPEFRPSQSEFADPIAYISKIEPQARSYGICKIIPPFSPLPKDEVLATLNRSLLRRSDSSSSRPIGLVSASENVAGRMATAMASASPSPPLKFSPLVKARSVSSSPPAPLSPPASGRDGGDELKATFYTRRQQLGCSNSKRSSSATKGISHSSSSSPAKASSSPANLSSSSAQKLVWQSGESYTLEQFEAKAKQFYRSRFKTDDVLSPLLIETLFWREASSDKYITVEYGNDIHASAFEEPTMASLTPYRRRRRRRDYDRSPQELSIASSSTTPLRKRRCLDLPHPLQTSFKEPALEPQKDRILKGTKREMLKNESFQESGKRNHEKDEHFQQEEASIPSEELHNSNQRETLPYDQSFCLNTTKDGINPPPSSITRMDWLNLQTGSRKEAIEALNNLAQTSWNMHSIARAPGSLLKYMPNEVPGVTTPMVYLGMLFSWFAWHVEDHELHSINYLHTGSPKTWYAVPGDAAQAFEEVVRVHGYGNVSDPQVALALLSEKTTVMSPEILVSAGVPCCRLVQNAGDFVITFPRAYHQGFSHGFNCGEAANFASPGWLEVAKEAATRRASINYLPMLSHQQLLYLLALSFPPRIPPSLSFEPMRSSQVVMEETIKTVFVDDMAFTNRLLGLLLDTGVTGCILLRDNVDLSCPPSEEIKHSNDLPTDATVSCEAKTSESLHQKRSVTKVRKHQIPVNTSCSNVSTICKPPFQWGTSPCAACGVLCFPTMAVVKPVSISESSNPKIEIYDANHLTPSTVVETHNNRDVCFLSDPLLQSTSALPIRSTNLHEGNATFEDEAKKETLVHEKSLGVGLVSADVKQRSKEVTLSMAKFVADSSSHQLGNRNNKENSAALYKDARDYDAEDKEKYRTTAIVNGMMSLIKQKSRTAEKGTIVDGSVSVLEFLAATYQDDSDFDGDKRKWIAGEAENGSSCFQPHSSVVSDDDAGYTMSAPWNSSVDDHCTPIKHMHTHSNMATRPLHELDNCVCKDIPFLKESTGSEMGEFMLQGISRVDCVASTRIPEELAQPLPSCTTNIDHGGKLRIFRDTDESDGINIFGQNRRPRSPEIENEDACMIHVKSVNYANIDNIVPGKLRSIDVNYEYSTDVEGKSTLDMQTQGKDKGWEDGDHDFRKQKLQSNETKTTNKIEGNVASRSGLIDGNPNIFCDPLCSETDVRPHCLCLQHALEARHKLKSLGGLQIVLICHSDIEEMQHCAKLFAEELNLSHCWRQIPFFQANDDEEILLNIALNMEEGGTTHKDWVVGLGMSVHQNRTELLSDQSGILQKDSCNSLTKKGTNSMDECNTTLTHTKNTHKRIRESYASGKVPKHKKISVAGKWCGKVWMNSQVHPVLGAHCLSVKESASDCRPKFSETPKSVIESAVEMNSTLKSPVTEAETQGTSLRQKRVQKRKTNRTMKNNSEPHLGSDSTHKRRKKREKEETGGSKYLSSFSCLVNQTIEDTGRTSWADAIDDKICPSEEISDIESEKIRISEDALLDHDESDADIWQDIDVECDTQEAMTFDGITGVPGNSLILHSHQGIQAGVQETLLLPGIMRRRPCSVLDSETHAHSLCQEDNCMPSHFVECTAGEALHDLMRSDIPEVVGHAALLERKQNHIPSKKKHSKDVYALSNLSDREFSTNTSDEVEDASFFGHSRDFSGTHVVRREGSGSLLAHTPVRQKIFADSDNGDPQGTSALEFVTEISKHVNDDSSQWRSSNGGPKSRSLIQCSNKKVVGKTKSKLRKRVKSESRESSDDEMIQRTTCKRAQANCDSDDQLFDYAGFFPEGPSTRLRTRSAAKVMKVDEDYLLNIDDNYNSTILDNVRRGRKPTRRRGKKSMIEDTEEEFGEYCCDIEGCTMSFASKQELNLHKRNACTFVGCGKRFGSHKYLLQHRRVHLDDRPLKCPWNGCQMTFKWKWACTEHYRVHTGERPYVCPVAECGQTFRFVSDFSRHKRKTGHGKQQSNIE